MHYLMSPDLYNSLTNVHGFTDMNGETYQKHIIIILGEFLSNEVKEKILNTDNIEEALKLINVPYTHEYDNCLI